MPAKNRVGRDNRGNLRQDPTTKTRAEDSQAPPFVVGQPHTLTTQLRATERDYRSDCQRGADSAGDGQRMPDSERHQRPKQLNWAVSREYMPATPFSKGGVAVIKRISPVSQRSETTKPDVH